MIDKNVLVSTIPRVRYQKLLNYKAHKQAEYNRTMVANFRNAKGFHFLPEVTMGQYVIEGMGFGVWGRGFSGSSILRRSSDSRGSRTRIWSIASNSQPLCWWRYRGSIGAFRSQKSWPRSIVYLVVANSTLRCSKWASSWSKRSWHSMRHASSTRANRKFVANDSVRRSTRCRRSIAHMDQIESWSARRRARRAYRREPVR